MAHFNNILVSNINRPFALFIVFYNKMFFHAFFRTNRQKTASSRSMFWMMVYTINIRIGWYNCVVWLKTKNIISKWFSSQISRIPTVPSVQNCVSVYYEIYFGQSRHYVQFFSFTHKHTHTHKHTTNETGDSWDSCLLLRTFSCAPNRKLVIRYRIRKSLTVSVTFRVLDHGICHGMSQKMQGVLCDKATVFRTW